MNSPTDAEIRTRMIRQTKGKLASLEKQMQQLNDTLYWLEREAALASPPGLFDKELDKKQAAK